MLDFGVNTDLPITDPNFDCSNLTRYFILFVYQFSETNPNQIISARILFVLRQRSLKHLSIVKSLKLSNNIFI
jgi:hypothetical protein